MWVDFSNINLPPTFITTALNGLHSLSKALYSLVF